jgi:hypothetical protein
MRTLLRLLAVPLLLAACGQPAAPVTDGTLAVRADPPVLRLSNRGDVVIYWTAMEAEFASRVDWIPCVDPARCPSLEPGQTRALPYEEIAGYEPGAEEAIVYWWRLVPRGNGFATDDIHTVRVRL